MCNSVEASAADREPSKRDNEHYVKCKAKCCKFCSYCARAFSKERNKSRGSRLLLKEKQIKVCEKCFLCHSIVLCQLCNKCSQCYHKSSCRGQTTKLLEKVVRSGCQSESGPNLERGLHPPLSDLAELVKNSHSHKLLWQSSQKSETVRGITSAYRQKCHRTSPQADFTRVLQPTIFSPKTQQQMEANLRSKQSEPFPKDRKIQDGDTGNHQDLTPTGRVGNLHRLQGRLLPYSDTGPIQEIPETSYPRPNLSIQSATIWPITSAHGVHCNSQGGKADGHSEGYKDPPIPRRLVGESHIPPGLSPTYTSFSGNVPGSRLDGELREVGTGTKANFQLCRLPVRPRVWSGPTDTGPVVEPTRKNTGTACPSGVFSKGVHVLDRPINRQITHETHSMASQKQLENTEIPRKGDSSTQVFTSPFTVVTTGKQCPQQPSITPHATCSVNLYRCIKRRVGPHLKEFTARGNWSLPESKLHINYLELKEVFLALQEFQDLCMGKMVLVATDNTTVVAYINKEGGMRSGPLCALLWRILTGCSRKQVTLKARHIPSRLNVVADKLSRLGQTIQKEWSLLPEVFRALCSRWHQPQIDLFATRFNNKLPLFVSPVPDPMAAAVDTLSLSRENLDAYTFPSTAILGKVVEKLQDSPYQRLIIIAPGWPNMTWFWDLVEMSSQIPLLLPQLPNLLTQPFNQAPHRSLTNLNLHAWLLEPQLSRSRVSLRRWQQELRLLKEGQPDQSMRQSGPFLQSGASQIRWTSGHHL